MTAYSSPSQTISRHRGAYVAFLAAVAFAWLAFVPQPAAASHPANSCLVGIGIVPPSCFVAGDGNQTDDDGALTLIDWNNVLSHLSTISDTSTNDTVFGGGALGKEQDPGKWQLTTSATGATPSKANVLAAAAMPDPVSGDVFVYGAFQRQDGSGQANLSFELNALGTTFDNDANPATPQVPERSEGDLLITFDGNAGSVVVGMCKWHGDRLGETTNAAYGWYTLPGFGAGGSKLAGSDTCTPLTAGGDAIGSMNSGNITNNIPGMGDTATPPNNIAANLWGEMAVNLTDALSTPANSNPCFSFGGIWLHSRSSSAASANMIDYVAAANGGPAPIVGAKSCAIAVDKKVAVQPGAAGPTPGAADYHQGTVADPAFAVTGDKLFYSFDVTNPGQTPVTVPAGAVTDNKCDSDNNGISDDPTLALADKQQTAVPAGPDLTPATLDPGDVWTYRCTRVLGAGDALPFSNTVTATGNISTPGCPIANNPACVSAQDTAVTSAKPVIDVLASSHTVTYGDAAPTITCTYDPADFTGGDDEADLTTSPNTGTTTYDQFDGVSGSPYGSSCSGATDEKYTFNYIAGTVTVNKKPIDVTASSHTVTYGDAKPTIACTFDAADFVGGDDAGDIDTAPTGSTTYDQFDGVSGSPYGTSCSGGSDDNYSFVFAPGAVTVNKAVIDVQASSHVVTFGDPKPTITCTLDAADFKGTDDSGDIDTLPTGSTTYDQFDGVSGSPYGTSCAGGADDNYSFVYAPGAVTVNKAVIDVQASSHVVTYGAAQPTITCTLDAADFKGTDDSGDIDTLPTGSTTYDQFDGVAGSPYATSCAGGADDNYSFNYSPGTVTVNKAVIDVQASSHGLAFGDPKPTITCTLDAADFKGTDDSGDIDTLPTGSTTYDQGDPVSGSPYPTSCAGGADDNYSFNYSPGSITVRQAVIDVQASSHVVTYGDAKPTVTCTLDPADFLGGDDANDIDTLPTGATAYDQFDGVSGSPYGTSCSGAADGDYSFNYLPGTVTVNKAVIDVLASSHTVTYGDAKPTITCTLDAADFKGTDDSGDIDTLPTGSTAYDQFDGVGGSPYGTSCAGGADDNYSFNYSPGSVTVNPKAIDVQASSHAVTYGDPKPTIACVLDNSDFVGGDDSGDIGTLPTGSTTYDQGDGVAGSPYGTSCSGGADDNYSFNYSPGSVTVDKKAVDVQASSHSVTYGDAKPNVTCAYDAADFVSPDTAADIDTDPSGATAYNQGDGVAGSPYGTSCSGGADDNYSFNYSPGQVDVVKAVIDVTASSHTLTYGDPKPNVTCTLDNSDFKVGDDANDIDTPPTGSTTYNQGDDVGTYPTSCAGGADDNYSFNYTPGAGGVGGNAGPGAITVTKKSVSGTFVAADKVYDGNTSATASNRALTGVLAGDTVTLQGGTAAFPNKNVGNDYSVPLNGATLGGADAGNYTLTGVANDLANITPAPIKGAFTAADKPYDGNTNATITGRSVTSGIVGSENVTLEGGTANFLDPEPGENKPVKGNGNFNLGGADKSNYVLVEVADTTATIQRPPAPAPVIDTTPQCLRRPVLAFVRGKRIKQVVFYLDGKKIGTAKKKDAKNRYATLIERKLLADGPHKLRAKVTFVGTKRVYWLSVRLKRCVGQAVPSRIFTTAPRDGSCPASQFLAFIKGGTVSSVTYTLNGKRLKAVRVADWKKRYAVKIDPSLLGKGPNVLEARVRFIAGSKKAAITLTEELPSCGSTLAKKKS